jgi:parallel beta-helix repeat protein
MKAQTRVLKIFSFGVIASIAVICSLFFAGTQVALAEVAHSAEADGKVTNYSSVDDALEAGYSGKTIIMDCDWGKSNFEIGKGKNITIDLNGHKLHSFGGTVMTIREGANVVLTSSKSQDIGVSVYSNKFDDSYTHNETIKTGGVITGGDVFDSSSTSGASAFWMDNKSTLTLDNVAVAGNITYWGDGTIAMHDNCNVYMKNGASIQGNRYTSFYVAGEDSHIYMDNSSIHDNLANVGAGVHSVAEGTRVYMTNGSYISNNWGGAICFEKGYSSVESSDNTAVISGNYRRDEGAGVIFEGSHGGCFGVTLKGNKATKSGGAIIIKGSDNTIKDCTITNNYCGASEEGGGVYVSAFQDITLKGKVTIKDNTRGEKGSADNLFLDNIWISDAYILGGVQADSKVCIRTGCTGERMIGKNISTYTAGTYFMDLSNSYYVSHGSDHNGDLWQRKL